MPRPSGRPSFSLSPRCPPQRPGLHGPAHVGLLSTAVPWAIYTALILTAGKFSDLNLPGLLWFALAGFASPFLFLTFYSLGIQRIGVARSDALKGAGPIFSGILVVSWLGERPGAFQVLGIVLVAGGIVFISSEGSGSGRRRAGGILVGWA
ncbi:MAG: DMT family transporter [Nitrospinota bacterium]|nr:DMT family transporter [Nitrospinota bacterium]